MPRRDDVRWPGTREDLYECGLVAVEGFCRINGVPAPGVTAVPREHWMVGACAFYRPDTPAEAKHRLPHHGPGINICLAYCAYPCGGGSSPRAWSWPCSTTDRTPLGVLAHELGHHCDWLTGTRKGRYYSEWCESVASGSGEPPLTSYAGENPAEYLAEAFRLFVLNPDLLLRVRPRTFDRIRTEWTPTVTRDWVTQLGSNCPDRVVKTNRNKVRAAGVSS